MLRRVLPLLLALAALGPAQAACTDPCENVDCGAGGAYVVWREGDVPSAERYRLCLLGRCHDVEPLPWGDPDAEEGEVLVDGGEGRPDEPVAVRLEAIGAGGELLAVFEGEREATGECCKAIQLRVDPPNRLVPHDT